MLARVLLKVGYQRAKGIVREKLYLQSGIDSTKPEKIRGLINQRCNYKCQYCYSWQREEYPEISIAEWQKGLLSVKEFIGGYLIQFSGGEPFVKKGFVDLLEFCHRNNINWGVITNGSAFTPKIVERVVAAHPFNIDISVDSPDALVNDFVRGAKDSVNTIGKGIKRLYAERSKRNSQFLIRIKPTVTLQNFSALPALVTWALECGADTIDFSPVRPAPFWDDGIYSNLWITKPKINELTQVVEDLIRMKNSGAPIETSIEKLSSFADHFLMKEVRHGTIPCRVGMRDFHINPNGEVEVCWEYPAIGNITKQSAKEIWESDKAREIRGVTVRCKKFGTTFCANSCLTHRTLNQEIKRLFQLVTLRK